MNYEAARELVLKSLVGIKAMDEDKAKALRGDETSDVELAALGIDSVAVMDFCLLIENVIGREIEITELIDHSSVNKLARHLSAA